MSEFFNEPFQNSKNEQILIDDGRYKKLANDLYKDNYDAIERDRDFDRKSIPEFLEQIDIKILDQYQGHGVTRGTYEEQIAAAISLLDSKIMLGYSASLMRSYTDGSLLVISLKNHNLIETDENGEDKSVDIKTSDGEIKAGMKIQPGAFVFNDQFDVLVEDFKKLFPNENILHAWEIADYIKMQEKK